MSEAVAEQSEEATVLLHPTTKDGRVRHYFTKVLGAWTCDCGESA